MTQTIKKPYNYCMDFLKGLACIFVVFIHVKFPGDFGQAVQAVARFAVPFFFMVSGCYYYRADYQGVIGGRKKILHIIKIFIFTYIFYLMIAILENKFLSGNNNFDFSFSHIIKVAFIDMSPSNVPAQLWFLLSLLELYMVWFIIDFFHLRKPAYVLACFSLMAMILLSQGAWLIGHPLAPYYYRNTWTEGFFFFTFGYFLHEKQNKIVISNNILCYVIFLSTLSSIVERFLCGRVFAVHLSTYLLVASLFVYAISNSERHAGIIQRIGKNYSMYVYILHIFVWHSFDGLLRNIGIMNDTIVLWLRPLMVLGLTLLASMMCYALFNRKKVNKEDNRPLIL